MLLSQQMYNVSHEVSKIDGIILLLLLLVNQSKKETTFRMKRAGEMERFDSPPSCRRWEHILEIASRTPCIRTHDRL